MIKETIKYIDYDGNEREEDFYFNLSKAELVEMQLSEAGGLEKKIQGIIAAKDSGKIIETFKDLIIKAYGVKSPDGRKFIKNDEIREDFIQTEAYSELFMKLATDEKAAADFINGIVPKIEANGNMPANVTEIKKK